MTRDAETQFHDAIAAAGLTPPPVVIADGKIHRFAANGKATDKAGWYALHLDGIPAGAFGCWRSGAKETWCATPDDQLTREQRAENQRRWRAAREAAERERDQERHAAEAKAATLWESSSDASAEHPYLAAKQVKAYGLHQSGETLLVPMRDADGKLISLQRIGPDGEKRFYPGCGTTGGFHLIGEIGPRILIAEGYATAASLHQATGLPVAVTFNCGNLRPVAEALRAKYPQAELVIAGDDDAETAGNPGRTHAEDAARVASAKAVFPDFGESRVPGCSDFNDLAVHRGLEAVREQLAGASEVEWPEPKPLPELAKVEMFEMSLLPECLRPWATDIVERIQCPADYIGAALMAALGALIGRKVGVRPQELTDWTVTPNQWALLVGRPGEMKSPAMEAALAPLKRLVAQAVDAHRNEAANHKARMAEMKLRQEINEKAARKALERNPGADISRLLTVEQPEEPLLRRYIANDTSAASLGELLRQNHNGLLVFRDEMVSLLRTLDREDSAEARGFYLTGWNGDSAYTFDRIGRGLNLHIPAVCLSLLGSTQPARLAEYVRAAIRGGPGDDGLLQRFGIMVWPDAGGAWRNVDRWPDSEAKRMAFAAFTHLDTLDPTAIRAEWDKGIDGEPDGIPYLRLSPPALELFLGWRTELETRLRSGDLHPAIESHLAKYRKLVPGLALILHLADYGTGPITDRAMLMALAWAEYLESHAQRAYGSVTSPGANAAKAILKHIKRGELKGSFGSRDVWRPGWAGLPDAETAGAGLALLCDLGWLEEDKKATGGRTATLYRINPKALL